MDTLCHPLTKLNVEQFIASPSHALMLVGAKGAGKEHIAKIIISQLTQSKLGSIENYPYLRRLDALDSKSHIDDVREIKKFLKLKTTGSLDLRRFVIVLNAGLLSTEAQNATLKLLEEPPEDTCIILTSSQPSNLKPTILSRVQLIRIRELSQKQITGIADDANSAVRLYNLSGGAPGVLASLMNHSSNSEEIQYISKAKQILSQKRYARLAEADQLIKDETTDIDKLLDSIYKLFLAKFKILAKKTPKNEVQLAIIRDKLEKTAHAQKLIFKNVQPKLALASLFYDL